jgi:platelet-activating factor acetylhydrolase
LNFKSPFIFLSQNLMEDQRIGCFDVFYKSWFRVYYPTEASSDYPAADWLAHHEHATGMAIFIKKNWLSRLFHYLMKDVKIPNSQWKSPIIRRENRKYPVIVFSHGLAGTRSMYSYWISQMVKRGYVVLALEHRYELF